jgi:hypothetical protein
LRAFVKVCSAKHSSITVSKAKNNYSVEKKADIESKRTNTMQKAYGFAYNSQRPEVKKVLQKPKVPDDVLALLTDKEWLTTEYISKQRSLAVNN